MRIIYNADLTNQRFLEHSEALNGLGITGVPEGLLLLGEIENPAVAWDNDEVEKLSNNKLIRSLFGLPMLPTVTEYDETKNSWFAVQGTWPASIDTLTHLVGQRLSQALPQAECVLDVACGTGMAGFYAFNKNPNIKGVDFSDIEINAVQSAIRNCEFARSSGLGCGFFEANGLPRDGKYDLIIASAVPATPGYEGLQRPLNAMFEGTGLLEDIVKNARLRLNKGGRLILSYSSNGDVAFAKALETAEATDVKTLYERDNAFRTEFLTNIRDGERYVDQDWIKFLVEHGGLKPEPLKSHPFRHTVRVKEVAYD